jgi:hypothetical protein
VLHLAQIPQFLLKTILFVGEHLKDFRHFQIETSPKLSWDQIDNTIDSLLRDSIEEYDYYRMKIIVLLHLL